MKQIFRLLVVIIASFVFTSCQKEEIVINTGIQVFDKEHPLPPQLSENTSECWIEHDAILKAKEIGFNCESEYIQRTGEWNNYNCGVWRTIEVLEYYGSVDGTRWISAKTIKLVLDENTFYQARDLSDKVGIIRGFFGVGQNPVGVNALRMWGVNHL